MEKSIRERIQFYQGEILKGNLLPQRAAEMLTETAALLGNLADLITERDIAYNRVLLGYLESEKTANRAKIKADITQEYKEMKEARNTEKVAIELMRSLKYFLKSREEEYKSGKFQ